MKKFLFFILCLVVFEFLGSVSQSVGHDHDEFQRPPPIKESKAHHVRQVSRPIVETEDKDCFFTGYAEFHPKDTDGNGIFNQLAVNVEVQVVKGGSYRIHGHLKKGDKTIAIAPFWESAIFSNANFEGDPGEYMVKIGFSGEQIFRSEIDGPYEVLLIMVGERRGGGDFFSFSTPAYEHQKFGEQGAYILSAEDEGVDVNGDGMYNFLKFVISVLVRQPERYFFELFSEYGSFEEGSYKTIFSSREGFDFDEKGNHKVEMFVPGYKIRRAELDGPYEGFVNLRSKQDSTIESKSFLSKPYRFSEFEPVLLDVKVNFKDE